MPKVERSKGRRGAVTLSIRNLARPNPATMASKKKKPELSHGVFIRLKSHNPKPETKAEATKTHTKLGSNRSEK